MKGRYSKFVERPSFFDAPTTSIQDIFSNRILDTSTDLSYPTNKYKDINYYCDGSASTIYKGTDSETGNFVILKKIKKKEHWLQEFNILNKLKNVSNQIINIEDHYESYFSIYFVMNFYTGGDLYDRVDDILPLSEKKSLLLIYELAKTIKNCHDNNIIHLDVKCENFICDNKKLFEGDKLISNIVLIDFGHATVVEDINDYGYGMYYGTTYSVCPEGFYYQIYSSKSDIWSLGFCLSFFMFGTYPFDGSRREYYNNSISLNFCEEYNDISNDTKNLLKSLMNPDPKKRPCIDKVLEVLDLSKCI